MARWSSPSDFCAKSKPLTALRLTVGALELDPDTTHRPELPEMDAALARMEALLRDLEDISVVADTSDPEGGPAWFEVRAMLTEVATDSAYAYTLHGPARPDSLVDTTSGTYLSNMHYDALFWATLMMAQIFEFGEGDARLPKIEEMFTSALPSAAAETYHARRSSYLKAAAKQQQAVP